MPHVARLSLLALAMRGNVTIAPDYPHLAADAPDPHALGDVGGAPFIVQKKPALPGGEV